MMPRMGVSLWWTAAAVLLLTAPAAYGQSPLTVSSSLVLNSTVVVGGVNVLVPVPNTINAFAVTPDNVVYLFNTQTMAIISSAIFSSDSSESAYFGFIVANTRLMIASSSSLLHQFDIASFPTALDPINLSTWIAPTFMGGYELINSSSFVSTRLWLTGKYDMVLVEFNAQGQVAQAPQSVPFSPPSQTDTEPWFCLYASSQLYIAATDSTGAGWLGIMDPTTHTMTRYRSLGDDMSLAFAVAFDSKKQHLYVFAPHRIKALSPSTLDITNTITTGCRASELACFDAAHNLAFVECSDRWTVWCLEKDGSAALCASLDSPLLYEAVVPHSCAVLPTKTVLFGAAFGAAPSSTVVQASYSLLTATN